MKTYMPVFLFVLTLFFSCSEGTGDTLSSQAKKTINPLDFIIKNHVEIPPKTTICKAIQIIQKKVPHIKLMVSYDKNTYTPVISASNKPLKYFLDAIIKENWYYESAGNTIWISVRKTHNNKPGLFEYVPSVIEPDDKFKSQMPIIIRYQPQNHTAKKLGKKIKKQFPDMKIVVDNKNNFISVQTTMNTNKKITDAIGAIDMNLVPDIQKLNSSDLEKDIRKGNYKSNKVLLLNK